MGVASAAARGGVLHDRDALEVVPLVPEPTLALCDSTINCGTLDGASRAAAVGEAVAAFLGASTDAMPSMRGLSDAVVCVGWGEGVPRALWCEHGAGVLPSALSLVLRFPA